MNFQSFVTIALIASLRNYEKENKKEAQDG